MAKQSKDFWNMHQFTGFSMVGVVNTTVNLFVYYLGLSLGLHYILAYSIGFLFSVCTAFILNNKYVFKNKKEANIVLLFIKVFFSYFSTYILSLLLMRVFIAYLKTSPYIAPLLKLIITIPFNFFMNKKWAFNDMKEDD